MDVLKNIKDLLYQHDCVILPEFGGFVANYMPAQVDYDRNIFAPPSKKISFNNQLTHNDGLLISSVSQSTGLGYKDAGAGVGVYVRDLKNRLEKGKKVVLEGLGTFTPGRDKTIQFEPDESVNYLVYSFGLSTFEFDLLEEFDVRKKIQSKYDRTSPQFQRRRRMIVRTTVIAIPLLVALTVVPVTTNWFRSPFNLSSLNPFKKTEQPLNIPAEPSVSSPLNETGKEPITVNSSKDMERADMGKDEELSMDEPSDPVMQAQSRESLAGQDMGFYVIVGSFMERNNAIRLQDHLQDEGFRSELFETGSGFIRVSLQGYASYDEARNARNDYALNHPENGYWILRK